MPKRLAPAKTKAQRPPRTAPRTKPRLAPQARALPLVVPPVFSRRIHVSEVDLGSWKVERTLIFAGVICLGFMVHGLSTSNATGWALSGTIILAIAVFVVSLVLWGRMEDLVRCKRGKRALFNATAQVDVGVEGISIQGLGMVAWADVHYAGRNNDDHMDCVLLRTATFHMLVLSVNAREFCAVTDHHLDQQRRVQPHS